MSLSTFVTKQRELVQLEKNAESSEIFEKISMLSPKKCEELGFSMLHMTIETLFSSMFGRTSMILHRLDKKELTTGFRVGDEVSLSGGIGDGKITTIDAIVTKMSHFNIEVSISRDSTSEDHSAAAMLLPPLRIDKRASDITYRKLSDSMVKLLKSESHPIVSMIFTDDERAVRKPDRIKMKSNSVSLNESQIEAIEYSLGNEPISILHGPPGTG